MTYDGTTLNVQILSGGASATQSCKVDISAMEGGDTAYIGFAGGTGALWASEDIVNWAYVPVNLF